MKHSWILSSLVPRPFELRRRKGLVHIVGACWGPLKTGGIVYLSATLWKCSRLDVGCHSKTTQLLLYPHLVELVLLRLRKRSCFSIHIFLTTLSPRKQSWPNASRMTLQCYKVTYWYIMSLLWPVRFQHSLQLGYKCIALHCSYKSYVNIQWVCASTG